MIFETVKIREMKTTSEKNLSVIFSLSLSLRRSPAAIPVVIPAFSPTPFLF